MFRPLCAGLALSLTLAFAAPVQAAEVVVFGDSWGAFAADELQTVLTFNGHSDVAVDNKAVAGSTADYWVNVAPDAFAAAVTANPDAEHVWLSIGGNDVLAYNAAQQGDLAGQDVDADIRAMLDGLFAVHPDVNVVMFGYDFVNFEMSPECIALGLAYFHGLATPDINQIFLDDIGEVQRRIAEDYENVTYVDVWGTLQQAGGIPGAPNVYRPSPSEFMGDCIHANDEGYFLLMQALYDGYFAEALPEGTGCSTSGAGASGGWWALALLALGLRRRRLGLGLPVQERSV